MKKGIYLIIILLFPSIIYMLFSLGEHKVKRVGYFGEYSVQEGDTTYNPVPLLSLRSSDGEHLSTDDLRGRVVIINLINWPCDEECYKQGATLANYLNDLGNNEQWVLYTISIDTGTSLEELADHSSKYIVEMTNWSFLMPTNQEELNAWLDYLFVQTGRVSSITDLPSEEFVMLDQNGIIREYFNSGIYKENKKMQDALKMLLKEPHLSWKDENSENSDE
ncbi:MAG: redoxin domain-containing protein [Flavobacteriales bacterium]|jgi:cytochrome oxidase Cu insertion factor (SCO1/SenC/PrrC family)|nr:redoxin domain-containing protein [Flavobacteriales bacterium]NCG29269.1 redoxin domain-containing protein [Bacteroidota bacterium]MBT3964358.1 redoxin domain-containing protein [Flavobacteriales bacterium]MBT4705142.1 redoxin domain-containing protein [Flavobacteriales bacterium]MBT4930162.1 redoxin domain-containing protein [Flavobacteriales bacterium]